MSIFYQRKTNSVGCLQIILLGEGCATMAGVGLHFTGDPLHGGKHVSTRGPSSLYIDVIDAKEQGIVWAREWGIGTFEQH